MYAMAYKFTERIPRVDGRTAATILELEPVKAIDAEALARKAIDNSLVEELVRKGLSKEFSTEGFADDALRRVLTTEPSYFPP